MKYCPNCQSRLDADMTVYLIDGEIVGCGECVVERYADECREDWELEEEMAAQDRRDQYLWDLAKEIRYGGYK